MSIEHFNDTPPPRGRPPKYPFKTMEVGDSFFVPGKTAHKLCQCWRRHRPRRFKGKMVVAKGVVGVRVTRTA